MNWQAKLKRSPYARARKPVDENGMNKTEAAYASHLAELKMVGRIRDYRFEAITLVLPGKVRYTPDFLVVNADFEIELHEVKGNTKVLDANKQWTGRWTWWAEGDAKIKIRIAAGVYSLFRFVVCFRPKGLDWQTEDIAA